MVHSRWHWCFNAYLFVHESSETRRTVSPLDLVVLFVLEMEGLSCQCAREGTCPVQWYAAICHQCFVSVVNWCWFRLCAGHTQTGFNIPQPCVMPALIRTPFYLCLKMQTDRFSLWKWCLVSFMMGLLWPLSSFSVCLEFDLHTKM